MENSFIKYTIYNIKDWDSFQIALRLLKKEKVHDKV